MKARLDDSQDRELLTFLCKRTSILSTQLKHVDEGNLDKQEALYFSSKCDNYSACL